MRKLLRDRDAWWLMFFYSVTFGGFVGLASSLPIYFNDQYGLTPVDRRLFHRRLRLRRLAWRGPFGGALADRIGGVRALSLIYAVAAVALVAVSRGVLPTIWLASPVLRRRHAGARHGQRRGVPARAAALRPRDRR